MAITFEASGQQEFATNVASLSFTPDANTQAGDVIVVAVASRMNATITLPAYVPESSFTNINFSGDRYISVFAWVAPINNPGTVSIPLSTPATGSVTWARLRGVDTSAPIDSDQVSSGGGTHAIIADANASVAGGYIVGGLFIASSTSTNATVSSGWTQRHETEIVRNYLVTKNTLTAGPGNTGFLEFTLSQWGDWYGWQLVLLPGSGAPPGPPADAVIATGQTEYMPGGYSDDIADTPAIWVNEDNPAQSVIVGSRKAETGGGIDLYDLSGARIDFYGVGEVNNVALRDFKGKPGWGDRILVVGTNRTNNSLSYAWLDRTTRTLSAAGSTAVGFEPYGTCLYVSPINGDVYAFVSEATGGGGQLDQYRLTHSGGIVSGTKVRDMSTATLSEGMACDDANQWLFLGEEDAGFYRYNAEPGGGNSRITIDTVGAGNLVDDVEGIAIAYGRNPGDDDYIIVSSQGDSTFAIYELASPHNFVRSFRVVGDGGEIDDVADTDGIAVTRAYLGPQWPDGLFVVHDSINTGSVASNFKLVNAARIFDPYTDQPVEISGTSTASLTAPSGRWAKSPTSPVWWDSSNQEWRGILPTSSGHRLYTLDPGGNTQGAVVDNRQDARITAVHSGGMTYVIRQHTSSTLFSAYNSSWTTTVNNVSVPLTMADHDATPISLLRTSNGYLWAAAGYGGSARVTRSTDGGATWSSVTTFTLWTGSATGMVQLLSAGSDVVLFATGNDGEGRGVRRVSQAAGSIAAGSWSSETLPSLPAGITSDDHLSGMTLPDGKLFLVSKTTGATTTAQPLLYHLIRATDGTWTMGTLESGPDETPPSYSRPRVTRVGDTLHGVYGAIYGAQDLTGRTMDINTLGTWSVSGPVLMGPNWSDSAVLPRPEDLDIATSAQWPMVAHNRDEQTVWVLWRTLDVTPPTEPFAFVGNQAVTAMYLGNQQVTAVYIGSTKLL